MRYVVRRLLPAVCLALSLAACDRPDLEARVRADVTAWLAQPAPFQSATHGDVTVTSRGSVARVTIADLRLTGGDAGRTLVVGDVAFDYAPGPDGRFAMDLPAQVTDGVTAARLAPGSRIELETDNNIPVRATLTLRGLAFAPDETGGAAASPERGGTAELRSVDATFRAGTGERADVTLDLSLAGLAARDPAGGSEARQESGTLRLAARAVPRGYLLALGSALPGGLSGAEPPADRPFPFTGLTVAGDLTGWSSGSEDGTRTALGTLAYGLGLERRESGRWTLSGDLTLGAAEIASGPVTTMLEGAKYAGRLDELPVPWPPGTPTAPTDVPFGAAASSLDLTNLRVTLMGQTVSLGRFAIESAIEGVLERATNGRFRLEVADALVPQELGSVLGLFGAGGGPETDLLLGLIPTRARVALEVTGLPSRVVQASLRGDPSPDGDLQALFVETGARLKLTEFEFAARDLTLAGRADLAADAGPWGVAGDLEATMSRAPGALPELWARAASEPSFTNLFVPDGPDRFRFAGTLSGDGPPVLNGQPVSVDPADSNPFRQAQAQAQATGEATDLDRLATEALQIQSASALYAAQNGERPPATVAELGPDLLAEAERLAAEGWRLDPTAGLLTREVDAALCPAAIVEGPPLFTVAGIADVAACPATGVITLQARLQ